MSLRRIRIQAVVALVLVGVLVGIPAVIAQSASKAADPTSTKLVGPLQHKNLAIYLVSGKQTDARKYITLTEAMKTKSVILRERGSGGQVNELEIENKSDQWLYIQAGDVIQGGKQDRTIGTDVAIPPHSKPQPISAFCVEHGRWTPKSGGMGFQANTAVVGSNALKRSIQGEKNQSAVWAEVAKEEMRARAVLKPGPTSAEPMSTTGTYNAIVENREIETERSDYVTALLPKVEKTTDALGIVVAINGEVTAADVYASSALFHKLARKLIDSYALEALLAQKQASASAAAPPKAAADRFLSDASKPSGRDEQAAPSVQRTTREAEGTVQFEYLETEKDSGRGGKLLHKNVVKK